MARSTLLMLACVAAAGCGGGCSGSADERDGTERTTAQRTESGGDEADPATPAADPGPPPEVRVSAELDAHARHATARIANHGPETRVARALMLERQRDDEWEPVRDVALSLRFSCEDEAPECVTLAPGAVFIPPPWLGTIGDAQCACEECAPAPAGTYRFVARSCGGGHLVQGDSFTLP